MAKPKEDLPEAYELGTDFKPTLDFLNRLENGQQVVVISPYPTINGLECQLRKVHRNFIFESPSIKHGEGYEPVEYQSDQYGFGKPFELDNGEALMHIPNGLSEFRYNLSDVDGKISYLESNYAREVTYCRVLMPLDKDDNYPLSYIESVSYKVNGMFYAKGLFILERLKQPLVIYRVTISDKTYVVVDSKSLIHPEEFKASVDAVLLAFGLISGCLLSSERLVLQSRTADFSIINGFMFERLRPTIHGYHIVDPMLHRHYYNLETRVFFPRFIYEDLVSAILNCSDFNRCVSLIVESSSYPVYIRASTYSVALETIKNIIVEDKKESIKPIKNPSDAKTIRENLNKVLDDIEDDRLFNDKSILYKRIVQINQLTNRDSLLMSFRLVGIDLSEEDIRCINYRNDFLHGRIPFTPSEDADDFEMTKAVFKLRLLVVSLLLKRVNYQGALLNYFSYICLRRYKSKPIEPLFKMI